MKLLLCGNKKLCTAWSKLFRDSHVIILEQPFETVQDYECVVSPANSFGLMDGGFDLCLTRYFGTQLMNRVQEEIMHVWGGEQPVGTCLIVQTGNAAHPYLAHTPTMRVPTNIRGTDNVYNAMRAMLLAVKHYPIQSVLCPGLGTATGQLPYDVAARQMYLAYESVLHPRSISWEHAIQIEQNVLT